VRPTPTPPAPRPGRPSARTPSARTAGTTVDVRSLRSSKRQPIEKALGIRFGGEELYVWAFTHRSYAYENGGLPTNERLEFLGDAVLGLVVTDVIYRAFPDLPEGQLAKLRAATVNMNVLAEVAREPGIGDAVQLGRGSAPPCNGAGARSCRAAATSPRSWPTPSRPCSGPSTWTRACRGRPRWCGGCSSTGGWRRAGPGRPPVPKPPSPAL